MAISTNNIGLWRQYTPEVFPVGAPTTALFCQRVGDDVDWYEFVKTPGAFTDGALVALAYMTEIGYVISAVTWGPMAVPLDFYVFEIIGHNPDDPTPHKSYEGKIYDPNSAVISDPPPVPPPVAVTYKVDFWRRCTSAEAAQFSADLVDADPQLARLFDAAITLQHDAPEFALLRAAVMQRVSPARAEVLLAPSE